MARHAFAGALLGIIGATICGFFTMEPKILPLLTIVLFQELLIFFMLVCEPWEGRK